MTGWRAVWVGVVTWALTASAALAGPPPADPDLECVSARVAVDEAPHTDDDLRAPVSIDIDVPLHLPAVFAAEQSIALRMPVQPSEGLDLKFRLHPTLTFYVAADLTDALPRLDAVDGESYWCPGFELHVTRALSVFVEDFQPTSGVTGGDEDARDVERAPLRSWDGHQIAVGVRYGLGRVEVRGELIRYDLSVSRRDGGWGGTVSLRGTF